MKQILFFYMDLSLNFYFVYITLYKYDHFTLYVKLIKSFCECFEIQRLHIKSFKVYV